MSHENLPDGAAAEPIHVHFARVAERNPGHVALVSGEKNVTYGELAERADALAHRLRRAGVRIETPVGVLADRSVVFVVAALAVLRAGGTYIPFSTEYPAERLRHLVEDSGTQLLLTTSRHVKQAYEFDIEVLDIEDESADPTGPAAADGLFPDVPADCLAYLIYTSGSTGQPKGVGVTHRNLTGLVTGQDYVNFTPEETFLQLAPTSFDASAWEIWAALLSGARLVIAAPSYQAIEELPTVLDEQQVTTLLLTPPLFHELVRSRIGSLASVRRLIVGGEAMAVPMARTYAADARRRGATFANVYGPTETTTLVSRHDIVEVHEGATGIPIGRPIENATIHLLDSRLRPVRPGETGQIHIGGTCVTRGYHGLPGLTARRFVPDPYSPVPGARMYATGDLGLLCPGGEIEFVGRADEQVKIRGHRVEPGEIESALLGHPAVHAAAVVAATSEGDSWQLVAHVVPTPTADAARLPTELRAKAKESLPAYMMPSSYRLVDALPTTPGGKLDRAKLRAVLADEATGERRSVPELSMSAAQQALSDIWRTVLDLPRVGLDEDFFALGGDSILAIRVIAAAEEHGIEIALTTLFSTPTIRAICPDDITRVAPAVAPAAPDASKERDGLLSPADLDALPEEVEAAYPATTMQLGLIFESALDDQGSLYHDVISRRIQGPWEEALFRRALDQVACAHPALRTRFSIGGFTVPLQLVAREPAIPLTVVHRDAGEDRSEAPQEDIADAAQPFDVEQGPLIRLRVSAFGNAAFQLTYGFHHAIMDGWSESVFITELLDAYAQLLDTGASHVESEPADGYASFVTLEHEARTREESRAFWADRLGTLPATRPPKRAGRHVERIGFTETLPDSVGRGLAQASEDTGLPFKSLVLAAHLAALGAFHHTSAPVTGIVVNGRPETTDGDRLIGLFLNLLPLRAQIEGSWADLARRTFDQERELLPHRRFPYADLHEMSGTAPFDVSFNYVQFHERTRLSTLSGLTVGTADIRDRSSHPLRVEVVREPKNDRLVLDVAADPALWTPEGVQEAVAEHIHALTRMAADPSTPVSPTDRP
ncbi:amino acid adenylation domain-containing protein [Streptomyces albidoflavus]|uniref:amino acid adenylation domain-containing protein n=1 Tax=Streptomyces albidoflavus TaxID=1886 RepID=UPI0033F70F57